MLSQDLSFDEYEILLVDDGSVDKSGAIADEYATSYKNVRVVHQKNQGLGDSRNAGIKLARGKYIQFVDSDDFLEANVLGALLAKMEKEQLDVLRFNYQNVNMQYKVFCPYKEIKPFVDYRDEVCDGRTFLSERLGYACYAVQFLMKTTLLKENGVFFKSGIYFEDTEWTPRMLSVAERVTSVETIVYNYLMREGSITQSSPSKRRKVLEDKLHLIDSLQEQARGTADKRWHEGMIAATTLSVITLLSNDFFHERKKYFSLMKKKGVFPLSLYHCSKRTSRKYKMINFSPSLFCAIHHFKNKMIHL